MKALFLVAALGVALCGCATTEKDTSPPIAIAIPSVIDASAATVPMQSEPGPWRIRKTEWSALDEAGFAVFVRAIAQSGCTTTIACMQSAANYYHDSDPPFLFHADCAKWVYMLRAYYASKNGLPFSYVSKIYGVGDDLRFTKASNQALERRDLVDTGTGIDTVAVLQQLHDEVWSATYRMDPADQFPVQQDFYSPKIQPGSIHAGTAIYDINGHVTIVYDVTADGSILYMDAHPDETVTRGTFGPHIPSSPASLGGGFKNFRPLKLEGAQLLPDGTYIGGHVVLAANEAIPDFSLEQYRGNAPDAANPNSPFRYNNVPLDLYEYARASMSNGGFAFNPVYELEVTMASLCREAKDGSSEADARARSGIATLYTDLANMVALWEKRDLRVVYHGSSLKETLAEAYEAQEHACMVAESGDGERAAAGPLEQFMRGSPATDIRLLIARIDESAPFAGMRPVGY